MKIPDWVKRTQIYDTVRTALLRRSREKRIRRGYEENLARWGRQYASLEREAQERALNGPGEESLHAFRAKEAYLLDWLREDLGEILRQYQKETVPQAGDESRIPGIVWIYWWDGLETAPRIVQSCVNSTRLRAEGFEVRLVDRTNLEQYLQVPPFLLEKQRTGDIGKAHFSDVVRMMLLARYGGMWMDATLYCGRPIPEEILRGPFYTCKKEWNANTPSHGRWSGWMLGGVPGFRYFRFMADALTAYWEKHTSAIDYLLMDYLFTLAYESFPELREAVDRLPPQNPMRDELMNRINEPYNPTFFDSDTFVYKLSYRYGNPTEYTRDGKRTFYCHILHENESKP